MTGQESSILALIAQRVYGKGKIGLSKRDKAKFYGMLEHDALQIAKAMTGDNPRPAKKWRDGAQYLKDWVASLPERKNGRLVKRDNEVYDEPGIIRKAK